MYLRKIHIENIRSIDELDWEIPEGQEAGWHVVIGDNGSGKTTFMRAIALGLIGDREAIALREGWSDWVRNSEGEGLVEVAIVSRSGREESVVVSLSRERKYPVSNLSSEDGNYLEAEDGSNIVTEDSDESFDMSFLDSPPDREFSAAYGPFRRFSGGDPESRKIYLSNPELGAHLTIFGEQYALTECLAWLRELKFKKLEHLPEGDLLDQVIAFINQEGFLPHHAQLREVSSEGVFFVDGDGHQLPVEELSDGYRSVLSLTFELIRQLVRSYGKEAVFSANNTRIIAPGVILIDEVDAHLHPTWQRRIGLWFREHFPNIQFIVTTHSPLVCQAAEHGTVFRLPAPGSGEKAEMVTGIMLNRLLYGDVLDAYGTELFGEDVGRSEAGQQKMQQLAELNVKEVNAGLSNAERKKQQALRAILPSASYTPETTISNGKRQGKRK